MGEHVGIERVSLGQLASRLGKVAYLAWVDRHDGKSSAPQYAQERQFQTSGCLEHDQRRSEGAHADQQFSYARRIVGDPPLLDGWPNGHLQVVTGHVDADEDLSGHSSSALANCLLSPNLARCGLALRPRQLFGLSAGPDWDDHASRRTQRPKGANGLSQSLTSSSAQLPRTPRRYKECAARHERSNDWRRGACKAPARLPNPYTLLLDKLFLMTATEKVE